MLEIHDIDVFIGEHHILKRISIDVRPGERVAVLGANGAGKTTLIKSITGLLRPRSGRIVFQGREIQELKSHRLAELGIACVPEGRRTFKDMSVLDNLRMGAYTPRARRNIEATLAEVTRLFPILADRLEQQAGTLSGGEQQMLAIGRALMSQPRLLLVDELSLGLAPKVVQEIYRVLDLIGQRITLLLVEQNVQQVLKHTERAYVMETGRVTRAAASAELLADPGIKAAYLGH